MKSKSSFETRRIWGFLDDLKKSDWLVNTRRKNWWPDYLFHFTNIHNAVSILREGALLNRNEAQARELMITDNASPEIIANTDDKWKDYARLYFRPKTPTQYRNEGFKHPQQRYHNAHCPVPIFFFFDSKSVLSRPDVRFTAGNLAANPNVLSTAAELERMPFERVYHDDEFHMSERNNIVFHRQAEVIVPHRLALGTLRHIVCRSQAEQETFLHLLPQNARMRWRKIIRIDTNRKPVFFKYWAYVESANLSSSHMTFHFNRPLEILGQFHAAIYVTDTISGARFRWPDILITADEPLHIGLDYVRPLSDYSVRLTLDGQLAFYGRYQDDLPW